MDSQEITWLLTEKYNGAETEEFLRDKERLQSGEPLAYIIGHVPFLSTTIHLDSRPLIPRPETEYWTEDAITYLHDASSILDLCAGSGCIGIAVLKHTNASVDFIEIDEEHHETIKKNVEENGVDISRVRILGGNLFEQTSKQYDAILANPPYIPSESATTDQSVREHEPHLALYAGTDGLDLIRRIISEASEHLAKTGTLYIEHEPEQANAIKILAEGHGFAIETKKDQYDILRYSILRKQGGESMAE